MGATLFGDDREPSWLAMPSPALVEVIDRFVFHVGRDRRVGDDVVYVGRTFAGRSDIGFGNPLRLERDTPEARARLLVVYRRWLDTRQAVHVRGRLGELTGRRLGCWCAPKLCHAMVLAGVANGLVDDVDRWLAELAALTGAA